MMTSILTLLASSIFFALAAFALAWWLDDQYGETVSKRLFGYAVLRMVTLGTVVIGLLVLVGVALAAKHWRSVTLGVCLCGLGALWGLMWLWVVDRRRMGRVLLSTRSPQAKSGLGVAIFLVVAGTFLLLAGAWNRDVIWILQGVYLLSFAMVEIAQVRTMTKITECGIYAPGGSVRWEQIKSCVWEGGTHEFSALMIQTRKVFLSRQLVRVPWERYQEMDDILHDRLGDEVWNSEEMAEPLGSAVPVHPIVEDHEKGPMR